MKKSTDPVDPVEKVVFVLRETCSPSIISSPLSSFEGQSGKFPIQKSKLHQSGAIDVTRFGGKY